MLRSHPTPLRSWACFKAQAAEGLPPFAPELPLSGVGYATLDHQVSAPSTVGLVHAVESFAA